MTKCRDCNAQVLFVTSVKHPRRTMCLERALVGEGNVVLVPGEVPGKRYARVLNEGQRAPQDAESYKDHRKACPASRWSPPGRIGEI